MLGQLNVFDLYLVTGASYRRKPLDDGPSRIAVIMVFFSRMDQTFTYDPLGFGVICIVHAK